MEIERNNLWILTEERPKREVIATILKKYATDHNFACFIDIIRILPILENGRFLFLYEVHGFKCNKIDKVFIKSVSGTSSFVDFLIYYQKNQPTMSDSPIYAIEETKTDDKESRNTGVYNSKFLNPIKINAYPPVTPQNINNFKQNNPELVIQDAKEYLGLDAAQCDILRQILLARGINKWLKVRLDLIGYKKVLRHKIKQAQLELTQLLAVIRTTEFKSREFYKLCSQRHAAKEKLKILNCVRGDLKNLCNTNRYQIWPNSLEWDKINKQMQTIQASDEGKSNFKLKF